MVRRSSGPSPRELPASERVRLPLRDADACEGLSHAADVQYDNTPKGRYLASLHKAIAFRKAHQPQVLAQGCVSLGEYEELRDQVAVHQDQIDGLLEAVEALERANVKTQTRTYEAKCNPVILVTGSLRRSRGGPMVHQSANLSWACWHPHPRFAGRYGFTCAQVWTDITLTLTLMSAPVQLAGEPVYTSLYPCHRGVNWGRAC